MGDGEGTARAGALTTRRISTLLGRGLDTVDLLYRPRFASPAAALARSRRDAPLTPADAAKVIAEGAARYNRRRRPDGPSALAPSPATLLDATEPSGGGRLDGRA